MKHEIRLSGEGGQGIILAGVILAEAAIYDGLNAIQSQSYGPEARGGASKAEIIISDDEINYPKVILPDILLILSVDAYKKYFKNVSKNGIILIDDSIQVTENSEATVVSLPIIKTAELEIKKPITTNIVALAALQSITNVVSKGSLEKAVLDRVPRSFLDINKMALEIGFKLFSNI
ncbi:2-oxoacid:acceptor oxidoreductase family protein [Calorimonas adulescens]|jgi:2-oxoglutarate ferredoxin oxidoreductase, gamma subunit (EC 1.2.7.3)|uniref:2-oxoacid:ferredoxin oxidoreductase subunit gamma n=1 Tax=Calorimonas adulescens TaxID=2606906 RepID=A0A5D8Q8K2_9THEO|nr:2-oxoacid:acceptor oxidoreductase family protein [Calorimonas adulescens]TZE80812.1 2-oxoacid:ferredoxin oxidoreductase subunit gamma [Calorimonas adulescens]